MSDQDEQVTEAARARAVEALKPSMARVTHAVAANAVDPRFQEADAIFNAMLKDCGIDQIGHNKPMTMITTAIGFVVQFAAGVVGHKVLHKRLSDLLDVVTDRRRRESMQGVGYMFRLDPHWITETWPEAEDDDLVNLIARTLRSAAMEVCELAKDDTKALAATRWIVKFTVDMVIKTWSPS